VECLLERQAVLAELDRLARGVRGGAGRVVLLRGEAGVGKTAAKVALAATAAPAPRGTQARTVSPARSPEAAKPT
jgi:flagellar biosynthesis GTPase FlhF